MKKFKEFIEKLDLKKTEEGHVIVPTPIHFKKIENDTKLKEDLDLDNKSAYNQKRSIFRSKSAYSFITKIT